MGEKIDRDRDNQYFKQQPEFSYITGIPTWRKVKCCYGRVLISFVFVVGQTDPNWPQDLSHDFIVVLILIMYNATH